MKPIFQTDTSPTTGNCFSACLASVLELDMDAVPNFFTIAGEDPDQWWDAVRDWLRPHGLGVISVAIDGHGLLASFGGWLIVGGKTARGTNHATVWRDGKMVHDPYPGGTGLVHVDSVDLLYPLNPAQCRAVASCSQALLDVAAERRRQIEVEGWTPDHDDQQYQHGELADAAACYALQGACLPNGTDILMEVWPFDRSWYKPGDRRRELEKSAALVLAQIELIDRSRLSR